MPFPFFFRKSGKRTATDGPAPLPEQIEAIRVRAMNGHHLEIVQWGQVLLDSVYMERDEKSAFEWFSIAANAGFGPGHNMVGRCHQFGWGCPQDYKKAAKAYAASAGAGDEWGRYNLGIMTMRGIGMQRDLKTALGLFRHAAMNNHAKSMNLYARFLEEGWETPQNQAEALEWYRRSAEGGDYRGQHNYATALVSAGNLQEALTWWRRAVVDATSDILLAMDRALSALGEHADPVLQARVKQRLQEMRISASQIPD